MIIFDQKVIITEKQNEEINKEVEEFVAGMSSKGQSVDFYKKNRNTYGDKVQRDIFLGKRAEYFVLIYLTSIGYPSVIIDTDIRKGNKKGWATDLPFNEVDPAFPNISVKACNKDTYRYCKDYSWTFQFCNNYGKNGKDKIFDQGDEVVCLTYMKDCNVNEAMIKCMAPWNLLEPLLKDPIKPTLKGLKKCLYYEDILREKEKICLGS